ncbi:MAG: radical SAM protein [Ignavibacteriaceae bacterium]|nr:radical SAM protein [Ignavibacteriaceae bacterium]
MSIVFGPIPSRRLGRSLGVNNIPPKICSYSCVYCQVGLTDSMSIERREFYPLEEIVTEISERVEQLKNSAERIDYITFVPDGEPTLDINIGKAIQLIKPLGIKIAVITNSSLLWDKEVREDLLLADWVSVKIDTTDQRSWHKINRPYGKLDLQRVLNGVKLFRNSFKGTLVTETMLVKGLNDSKESLTNTADFIGKLNPNKAYILVPTRPPAEKFVESPSEENLNIAYQIFNSIISNVEFLTGGEGSDFTYSSDVEKELLDILAVHPMKKEAVEIFLNKAGTDWSLIEGLINKNILKEVQYSAATFIIKNVLVESRI